MKGSELVASTCVSLGRNDIITTLFIQAWWEYLTNDRAASEEILMHAITYYYTGFPFPVNEVVQ